MVRFGDLPRRDDGNVSVWFALALMPLTIMLGSAVDYANATMARANLQAATDQAALSAAAAAAATDQDRAARASSFFPPPPQPTPGSTTSLQPTASVAVSGRTVSVSATRQIRTAVLGVMGVTQVPVSARSTAQRVYRGPPICMMALNATASGAISFGGNATFVADGCAVYSNSSSGTAIQGGGSATARAGGFCAVGGVSASGSTLTPTPEAGCDRLADPFQSLAAPATPAATYNNVTVQPNTSQTLSPGTYKSGLTIKGSATLNPGLYVINGSLTISSQANVTGAGVTFFLTGSQAGFTINGGGTIDLSAMTTGPYAGLLIVQDRTANVGNDDKLNGDSGTKLVGGIYLPTQTLTLTGSSGFGQSSGFMPIIADKISVSGNATAHLDTTVMSTATALPLSRGGAILTQ